MLYTIHHTRFTILLSRLLCALCILVAPALAQTNPPAPPPAPRDLYRQVEEAITAKQFGEAQRMLDQLLALDSSFPEAHRASAYVHYELGHYAEAEDALEKFRQLVPADRHNILILLGRIQMAQQKYREAVQTFERVALLKPTADGIYTSLGKLYYFLEEYPAAIDRLETARKRDPPRFQEEALELLKSAYAQQIDRLVQQDQLQEAVDHLDRLLGLDPPMAMAFLKRGAVLSGLGTELSQAETDVITYVSEHPGTTRAYLLLGNIRQQMGKVEQAIESYESALELDPDIPGVNAVLGALHYRRRDFERAVDRFQKAAAAAPNDANVKYSLGMAYLRLEDFEKASQAMASVIEVKPEAPGPYLILAQVALSRGQIELALERLEQWAARVRTRGELEALDTERIFERLYNNSQYRALVRDLKAKL